VTPIKATGQVHSEKLVYNVLVLKTNQSIGLIMARQGPASPFSMRSGKHIIS
jgi:hypothetical protein